MAKAKRIKGLKCNSIAASGIELVLRTRFEEMCGFHETALDWSDPEGVHAMRVASRRLRSALKDFMPYLRKRGLTSVLKQVKDLGDALGEVRDQDVAILALEKIESHAPIALRASLQQFIEPRQELRDKARKNLKSMMMADQLKDLSSDFITRIGRAASVDESKTKDKQSPVTFLKMSAAIILERLKELEELSDCLFRPFDVEPLHEMRIAAKRLRYALELFQQCWGRAIAPYAKRIARLQSALGEVHDCDVWIESIDKLVGRARKEKSDDQVNALVWLLSYFIKLRTKHLRQALTRWREWEAQEAGNKLRTVLKGKGRPAESSLKLPRASKSTSA
jgi:CHAD domain-containing protein